MSKLYVVCINESFVRDAQVVDFDCLPEDVREDEDQFYDYINDNDDCWGDCYGSIFVDVIRANSDEDAIEHIAALTGYDKRILTSICINE